MGGVLAVTAPLYLLMGLGWLAVRAGWFAREHMRVLGGYVLRLALPALLFNALASRRFAEILEPAFLLAFAGGGLVAFATGLLWARRLAGKPLAASAIVGMGCACPNSGFIGVALVAQLFGAGTAALGLAMAMLVENLLLLPLALALSEAGEGPADAGRLARMRAAAWQALRNLLRTPMVLGLLAGLAFSLLQWKLPVVLQRPVELLAASCSPVALVVIGGTLAGLQLRGWLRETAVIATCKLLVHPLVALGLVLLLPPMPTVLQQTVVLMAAVPMLGIYPVLAQKSGNDQMAAAAQLGTTVVSFFTLSAVVALMPRLAGG